MSLRYLLYFNAFPPGVVMPHIDPACRADIVHLLELGWRPDAIAEQLHVSQTTVYNTEHYLIQYGQPVRPHVRKTDQPVALTRADKEALFELLLHNSWKYLDKIQYWLYHKHNLNVACSIIHYILKQEGWSKKAIKCMAQGHNSQLRELYCNNMRRFLANIMVFFNKAIFNKKTNWRTKG